MNNIDSQPTPTPFDAAPTRPTGGGCSRVGVIGCGVLTLLLGLAAILFLVKAGDLFAWALSRFEAEVTKALPEECTESDRQRLHRAFAQAGEAVRSGEFDPSAVKKLQEQLRESLLAEDQELTREQVLELTRALEEVAGEASEDEVPEGEISLKPVAA